MFYLCSSFSVFCASNHPEHIHRGSFCENIISYVSLHSHTIPYSATKTPITILFILFIYFIPLPIIRKHCTLHPDHSPMSPPSYKVIPKHSTPLLSFSQVTPIPVLPKHCTLHPNHSPRSFPSYKVIPKHSTPLQ